MLNLDKVKARLQPEVFDSINTLVDRGDVTNLKKWLGAAQEHYKFVGAKSANSDALWYEIEYLKYLLQLKENKMLSKKEKFLVKEYATKLLSKKTPSKKPLKEAGEENSPKKTEQEIFDSIDWEAVGAAILNKVRIKTKLSFVAKPGNGGKVRIEMKSDDIIDQCGIFKYAIASCFLNFFGAWILDPKEHQGVIFQGTLNFTYPGNGMDIGYVSVYENGKIIVALNKPRG